MRSGWRTSDEDELVADCDALLTGRFAERLMETDRVVPAWAWLNLAAHGTERDLRRPRMVAATREQQSWCRARAYVAGEIVMLVDTTTETLAELQHDVLVPLELELLRERAPGARTASPEAMALTVLAALDADRRARRHR